MALSLIVERRRRVRLSPRERVETIRYTERVRLPLREAVSVSVLVWLRRRAFRVIRWTQNLEARAYASASVEIQ